MLKIHFLNGNTAQSEAHYAEKEYRDDILVQIDTKFYEVYFFVASSLEYEMRKDGFFSLPGMIILDEVSNRKIIDAIIYLSKNAFFDKLTPLEKFDWNLRYINTWYANDLTVENNTQCDFLLITDAMQ